METKTEDTRTTTTVKTSSRELLRRTTTSTDMRRKRDKMASKERKAKRPNLRKSTSPSKRRMTKLNRKVTNLKHQPRPRPQPSPLKWPPLNEPETRS
jgi:hypothetical protein